MTKQLKWFLFAFLFSMGALGIANTVNGTVTSSMISSLGIIESQRGLLVTLQGGGTMVSVLVWVLWGERVNKMLITVIGAALVTIASGMVMFNMGYYALMPIFLVFGFGFTCIDVMSNAVAMDVFPMKKNTVLLLHAYFGVGAMLGSIAASWITNILGWQYAFLLLAGILLVVILVYGGTALKAYPMTPYANRQKRETNKLALGILIKRKETWAIFFTALFFGASQMGPIIWLGDYFKNTLHSAYLATFAIAALFAGTIASRFFSTLLIKRIKPQTLFITGALLACGAFVWLALTHNDSIAIILTILTGFFAGANFPLLVLMGGQIFPQYTSTVSATICMGYAVSTMTVPWLMGVLAKASPMGMRVSFLLVAAAAILMAVSVLPVKPVRNKNGQNDLMPDNAGS